MIPEYAAAFRYQARHRPMSGRVILRAFVRKQVLIALVPAVGINAMITWLMFHDRVSLELWGVGNVVFDLFVATVPVTFGQTLIVTLDTRKRLSWRRLEPMHSVCSWLVPRRVVIRAVTFAVASLVAFAVGLAILLGFWAAERDLTTLLAFKVVYCVLLTLVSVPITVLAALSDRVPLRLGPAPQPVGDPGRPAMPGAVASTTAPDAWPGSYTPVGEGRVAPHPVRPHPVRPEVAAPRPTAPRVPAPGFITPGRIAPWPVGGRMNSAMLINGRPARRAPGPQSPAPRGWPRGTARRNDAGDQKRSVGRSGRADSPATDTSNLMRG